MGGKPKTIPLNYFPSLDSSTLPYPTLGILHCYILRIHTPHTYSALHILKIVGISRGRTHSHTHTPQAAQVRHSSLTLLSNALPCLAFTSLPLLCGVTPILHAYSSRLFFTPILHPSHLCTSLFVYSFLFLDSSSILPILTVVARLDSITCDIHSTILFFFFFPIPSLADNDVAHLLLHTSVNT